MIDRRAHHIPDGYVHEPIEGAVMWRHARDADPAATATLRQVAEQALADVPRLLEFRRTRTVHVVIYESLEDSRTALGRAVSPGFLLAPLHTAESAVIVVHSPRLDPSNADAARMLRHLCHEVAHVCTAERTGSVKRLGDGDVGMRVRPWVDEGFAVCVAARVADQPALLERALGVTGPDASASMDLVDAELRALDSVRRSLAFGVATARVWTAIQRSGFRFVFDHLDTPGVWT